MTDSKPKLLLITQTKNTLNELNTLLSDDYEITLMATGKECLSALDDLNPDVLLIDTQLSDMSGIEVCSQIRENKQHQKISIIFISNDHNIEELLAAYQAGGDEYISHPFSKRALLAKIHQLHKHKCEHQRLSDESQQYMNAAMEAITGSGELGIIIMFMQKSYACHDYKSLSNVFFEALTNYNLTASLMIDTPDGPFFSTTEGELRDIENTILDTSRGKGRIVELKNRSIYNTDRGAFLIRNMPIDNNALVGRLRDHLATIVVGLNERLKGIANEQDIKDKQIVIREVIHDTNQTLEEINRVNQQQRSEHASVLSDLGKTIEASYTKLGLTDEQESFLSSSIEEAEQLSDALYESGVDLDTQFQSIVDRLSTAIGPEPEKVETVDDEDDLAVDMMFF